MGEYAGLVGEYAGLVGEYAGLVGEYAAQSAQLLYYSHNRLHVKQWNVCQSVRAAYLDWLGSTQDLWASSLQETAHKRAQ